MKSQRHLILVLITLILVVLTVCQTNVAKATGEGTRVLSVKAAPSGAAKTTNSTGWVDVPDLNSSIATAANSNLEITVSGEVNTSGGKRMFLRALVDGQRAYPSDVVFVSEGFTGIRSFTFVKENLGAGPHTVQIQWLVDPGGIASIGDRTLSLNYWQGQVPDLSKPFYSLRPVTGKRKVLAILWDPHRPDHPAPSKSAVENLIFGPKPSVRDYFLENSGGRFTIEKAGVLGWYDAEHPYQLYWREGPFNPENLTVGDKHRWVDVQGKYGPKRNFCATRVRIKKKR